MSRISDPNIEVTCGNCDTRMLPRKVMATVVDHNFELSKVTQLIAYHCDMCHNDCVLEIE